MGNAQATEHAIAGSYKARGRSLLGSTRVDAQRQTDSLAHVVALLDKLVTESRSSNEIAEHTNQLLVWIGETVQVTGAVATVQGRPISSL